MTDLLPCPFCGSEKLVENSRHVFCRHCATCGPDKEDKTCDWNTRAKTPTDPLSSRIKELEKGDAFLLYKKLCTAEDEIKDLQERAEYWKNEYEKVADNYAPYLEILYKIAELLPQDIKHGVMLAYKSIEEKEQP